MVKKLLPVDIRVLIGRQEALQNLILNGSDWVSDLIIFSEWSLASPLGSLVSYWKACLSFVCDRDLYFYTFGNILIWVPTGTVHADGVKTEVAWPYVCRSEPDLAQEVEVENEVRTCLCISHLSHCYAQPPNKSNLRKAFVFVHGLREYNQSCWQRQGGMGGSGRDSMRLFTLISLHQKAEKRMPCSAAFPLSPFYSVVDPISWCHSHSWPGIPDHLIVSRKVLKDMPQQYPSCFSV